MARQGEPCTRHPVPGTRSVPGTRYPVNVPLLLVVLLVPVIVLAMMPLILVQRYRAGKARRRVRGWNVALSFGLIVFSTCCFLAGAMLASIWVPRALTGAVVGLAIGAMLGVAGLLLTRWEPSGGTLHYTPNRWLVLVVTFLVSARMVYGLWRSWSVASAGVRGTQVLLAFGVPESLAAGGVVIGYHLAYAWGLRRRVPARRQR